MKKVCILLALFAVALMPLDNVVANETIDIGFAVATTGHAARVGLKAFNGATIALNEINAADGILGKKLKLVLEDHKCEPTEGVNAASKLIFKDKVVVLIADTSQYAWSGACAHYTWPHCTLNPRIRQDGVLDALDIFEVLCYA